MAAITFKQDASLRTKNRIREHGPRFRILSPPTVVVKPGQVCLIAEKDSWSGWLPLEEIEVTDVP